MRPALFIEVGVFFMDYKVFRFLNQLSGRVLPIDFLMIFISNKIRYLFMFILLLLWIRKGHYRILAITSVFSAGLSLIIYFLIKLFYFKPRPFIKHRVGILIPSKVDSSFPSKHTMLVFAVSTAVFLRERVLGLIMLLLSGLTGLSRVWLGHHYPFDIIGSAFIACITSVLINFTKQEIYKKE